MPYTPENNPYIPGDPYSYDLKWVVNQIKYAISLYEPLSQEFSDLSGEFDALEAYVHDYFASLDLTEEVRANLDAMAADGTLTALIQPLFDEYAAEAAGDIAAINSAISTLTARMDAFSNLPSGSTAGDAELTDIRIAYTGQTYSTAGDAVRAQAAKNINPITLYRPYWIWQMRINPSGNNAYQANALSITSWFITVYQSMDVLTGSDYTAVVHKKSGYSVDAYDSKVNMDVSTRRTFGPGIYQIVLTYTGETLPANANLGVTLYFNNADYILKRSMYTGSDIIYDKKINRLNDFKWSSYNSGSSSLVRTARRLSLTGENIGYMDSTANNSGWFTAEVYKFSEAVTVLNMHATATYHVINLNDYTDTPLPALGGSAIVAADTPFIIYRTYISSIEAASASTYIIFDTDQTITSDAQPVSFNINRNKTATAYDYKAGMPGFAGGNGTQDADQYGDIIVMFTSANETMYIRSAVTNELITSHKLTYADMGHANCISFSDQFYDPADNYPLLLVSDWYNPIIHVMRIANDYNVTIVNTINVTAAGTGYCGFAYDRFAHKLYAARWNTTDARTGVYISVLDGAIDVINDTTAELRSTGYVHMPEMILQGMCAYNGYLFMCINNSGYTQAFVYVVDIASAVLVDKISALTSYYSGYEIEGVWIDPDITSASVNIPIYIMRYTSRIGVIIVQ